MVDILMYRGFSRNRSAKGWNERVVQLMNLGEHRDLPTSEIQAVNRYAEGIGYLCLRIDGDDDNPRHRSNVALREIQHLLLLQVQNSPLPTS